MNNGFFVAIIFIIIVVFGGIIFYSSTLFDDFNFNDSNNDSLNLNNTDVENISSSDKNNGSVVAIQSGPAHTKEGSNVKINWVVKNKGNSTITGVKGMDQNYESNFGSIGPGESKSIKYSLYIPSNKDMQEAGFAIEDEGNNDEFFIGGFSLSYSLNGNNYVINSNNITIVLD